MALIDGSDPEVPGVPGRTHDPERGVLPVRLPGIAAGPDLWLVDTGDAHAHPRCGSIRPTGRCGTPAVLPGGPGGLQRHNFGRSFEWTDQCSWDTANGSNYGGLG